MKKLFYILFISLLLTVSVNAADYRIRNSSQGGDTGADCANAKSLSWFNANAAAGDTGYLCDNEAFTSSYINPTNEGTNHSTRITYQNETGDSPVISGQDECIYNHGTSGDYQSYITVDGIECGTPNSGQRWLDLEYVSYWVIKNVVIDTITESSNMAFGFGQVVNSDHIVVDSIVCDLDDVTSTDQFECFRASTLTNSLFINNTFGDASHTSLNWTFGTATDYNVFKGNTFTNKWRHGLEFPSSAQSHRNLVEGNFFDGIGRDNSNCPFVADQDRLTASLYMRGADNIVRFNVFNDSAEPWFLDVSYHDLEDNWYYHNTVYDTNKDPSNTETEAGILSYIEATAGPSYMKNNEFFNNIIWRIEGQDDVDNKKWKLTGTEANNSGNSWDTNIIGDPTDAPATFKVRYFNSTYFLDGIDSGSAQWANTDEGTGSNYPQFLDPDNSGDTYANRFGLQSGSPAVDAAKEITTANGNGSNSTTLTVQTDTEFAFFSQETWDHSWHGYLDSDTIKIGSAAAVKITAIDYVNNQLTLASARSWSSGDKVYICPAGSCFAGSAPDIGALEYEPPATEQSDISGLELK